MMAKPTRTEWILLAMATVVMLVSLIAGWRGWGGK